jgi:hypothetical protein
MGYAPLVETHLRLPHEVGTGKKNRAAFSRLKMAPFLEV